MTNEERVIQVKAINISCIEEEYATIKSAAEDTKRSMAAFCLYSALQAAKALPVA